MRTVSSGSERQSPRVVAPGVSWPTGCASARTGATRRANFASPRRDGSCRSSPRNLPCRRRRSACRRRRRPGIFRTCRFAAVWRRLEKSRWNRFRGAPTGSGGAMATHHPQRWTRPPGAQRCYWIVSSRHGRLGGIAFCAASWHQKARDEFVGWSADARVANLQRMVNNNRFLLLPGVRVHGLASHVLDLAATRLPGDWEAAYGVRPLMAYTYVSPDRRLLSRGRMGALRQADVGVAARHHGEGRRAVGRSRWPPTGKSGCAGNRNGRSASPRRRLRPTIGRNGTRNAPGRTHSAPHGGARMGGTARRTGTGDLSGQGRSSLPAAVESEGEHGARS